ncbi:MAG: hypothetical protein ACRCZF_26255, partial [Gemmataceae bacterium]
VRAMNYPDPRVQLAGAMALLKIPGPPQHGATARVVDILRRAAGDATVDGKTSRALICDPSTLRAERLSIVLQAMGYETEHVGSGRELFRRVADQSTFDVVFLDRHVVQPELKDTLASIHADSNLGRRPILVVASLDKASTIDFEHLLVRLTALIAATETEDLSMPPHVVFDKRKSKDELEEEKRLNAKQRDNTLKLLVAARNERMTRIVTASNTLNSPTAQQFATLRLLQLTHAALIAEYDLTPASAPEHFERFTQVSKRIQQETVNPISLLPTESLTKLAVQLETVLTKPLRAKFDSIRRKMDGEKLGITNEMLRDQFLEAAVERQTRSYPGVRVISSPYSPALFEDELKTSYDLLGQQPRDPQEKYSATLEAVKWIGKLASGEVVGYDVTPAEPSLRSAAANDDLAMYALPALAKLPLGTAQQELAKTLLLPTRTPAVKQLAFEQLVRSIQTHGRLLNDSLIAQVSTAIEKGIDPDFQPQIRVVKLLVQPTANDLSKQIQEFRIDGPPKPAAAGAAPAGDAKPAEGETKAPETKEK